jgi:DNA mismatch endonuclease (patch repair protein)
MSSPAPSSYVAQRTMQANRRADTKPEIELRAALHARGLRFRKDFLVRTSSGVKTKVDVAFTRAQIAVFVDGCFWHGCPEHGVIPRANSHYWEPKLNRNRKRDREVTASLESDGWTVVRFWEHELLEDAVEQVSSMLDLRAARLL